MNERIKKIRKHFNLNQEDFGKRLGVTKTAICALENGRRNLTTQMTVAISREFNISTDWLLNGTGSMIIEMSRGEEIASWIGTILNPNNEKDYEFAQRFILMLSKLDVSDWAQLEMLCLKMFSNIEDKKLTD